MHRVELKVQDYPLFSQFFYFVPNAPCGVESYLDFSYIQGFKFFVPNAPCGVESKNTVLSSAKILMFLMHRVELKVGFVVFVWCPALRS